MKRTLAGLLVLGLSIGALAADVRGLPFPVSPISITPRTFYVQGQAGVASSANAGFNSNAGFVVTSEGVVVIDALGTPALGAALLAQIRQVTDKPVRRVIVTHYHADHFYGLQAFKDAGAEIWAHKSAQEYLDGGEGARRLEQRARDLDPWVDEKMPLVRADKWLDADTSFTLGGVRFDIAFMGPAHSPEDLIVAIPQERVVFTGDILFTGRIPFVGEADSFRWLQTMLRMSAMNPRLMVPGHGEVSRNPERDFDLTRDYITFLRTAMRKAVEEFVPFDEAYARTDWSRFAKVPAFDAANRVNAYGQYLALEREFLKK